MTSRDPEKPWTDLLAVGLVANNLTPVAIARYAGVPLAVARDAIDQASIQGLLCEGKVDPDTAARLVAEIPGDQMGEIHAAIARHLLSEGPEHLSEAVRHLEIAGQLLPQEELVDLAEQGGRTAMSVSDYQPARQLLTLAEDLDPATNPIRRASRLRDLGAALNGLGLVQEARKELAKAFEMAEAAGDTDLAVDLALRYSYPVDWYAGDLRAGALLQRASALNPNVEQMVEITAARATVEMRIPVTPHLESQLSWITRASLAQPLAAEALARSEGCSAQTQLIAALAWRTTHRAPDFLAQRREISQRALDLAQALRLPDRQADAAIMLAVDAIESGDRALCNQAISVARWVAEEVQNPRLLWHVHTVAAGAAHLDDDLERAEHNRSLARQYGESINAPGWMGADLLLMAEEVLARDDPAEMAAIDLPEDFPAFANPIGRLAYAFIQARTGQLVAAEANLRMALRQLDREASLLLVASRAAALFEFLEVPDVAEHLIEVLSPWAEHFAVDSNAWWCDGPVSLALGILHFSRGRMGLASDYLAEARSAARSLGDMRSVARINRIHALLPTDIVATELLPTSGRQGHQLLTQRERQILDLMCAGATNREIAEQLAFSLSTIRADTTAIYRKLGVKGRAEAVAIAVSLSLN
jgi:DNA-binding CsgD family transcriptional regulator